MIFINFNNDSDHHYTIHLAVILQYKIDILLRILVKMIKQ